MKKYLSLLLIAIFAVSMISAAGVVTTKKVAAFTPYESFPTVFVRDSSGKIIGSMSTEESRFVLDVVTATSATYYFKPTYMRANIQCTLTAAILETLVAETTVKTFYTESSGWAKDGSGNPIGFVSGYLPSNVVTAIQNPDTYTVIWYLDDEAM
jgi:hypothetical protein